MDHMSQPANEEREGRDGVECCAARPKVSPTKYYIDGAGFQEFPPVSLLLLKRK